MAALLITEVVNDCRDNKESINLTTLDAEKALDSNRDFYTKMYTPFLIGLNQPIWTTDMRIMGTEPSSVILRQTCSIKKLKSNDQKVPKQAEAKRDDVVWHDGLLRKLYLDGIEGDTCLIIKSLRKRTNIQVK